VKNSSSSGITIRMFFSFLFGTQSILKIINATRASDKAFVLWTLISENPFDPATLKRNDSPTHLWPFIDLTEVFPRQSFPVLVDKLLGGLVFCDFEENSDWSRADYQFLRESQLHFVATRTWLSLQLFHAIEMSTFEDIPQELSGLCFPQVFGVNFFVRWESPEKTEFVKEWMKDNRQRLKETQTLVMETQDLLRRELQKDLMTEREKPISGSFSDYNITE
jgi:hypothetical protein